MEKVFWEMDLERLKTLHRVAKTRGHAFFRDPHLMILLREIIAKRENVAQSSNVTPIRRAA